MEAQKHSYSLHLLTLSQSFKDCLSTSQHLHLDLELSMVTSIINESLVTAIYTPVATHIQV